MARLVEMMLDPSLQVTGESANILLNHKTLLTSAPFKIKYFLLVDFLFSDIRPKNHSCLKMKIDSTRRSERIIVI